MYLVTKRAEALEELSALPCNASKVGRRTAGPKSHIARHPQNLPRPPHIFERRHIRSTILQLPIQLRHVVLRQCGIRHRQVVDDDQAELVFWGEGAVRTIRAKEFENGRNGLLGDGFFGAEEFVEPAFLDLLEEGGGHVHVGVERGFASCKFGELGDGGFEVGSVGGEVAGWGVNETIYAVGEVLNLQLRDIVRIGDSGASGNLSSVLLVLGQLGIDFLGHLREWLLSVSRPEEVFRVEIELPLRFVVLSRNNDTVEFKF